MSDMRETRAGTSRGLLVLAAVFIAGAVAGTAAERYYVLNQQPHTVAAPGGWRTEGGGERPPSPELRRAIETGIPTHFVRLGLTAQQESVLAAISRRRRPRADSIVQSLRPVASKLETQMMQEMLCALTLAQQAHWLAYMDTVKFDPVVVAERYAPIRTHTCASLPR
jgi:hypothetical protein